jgi:hypothetical protein
MQVPSGIAFWLVICHLVVPALSACAAESSSIFRYFRPTATQTNTKPHPAVVRVQVEEADAKSSGSGTFVAWRGQHGLVVTNWHVVRDAAGLIEVIFPDGFRSAATLLKTDQDWDLAALLIWRPKTIPIPISHIAPQPGDSLTIAGYGQGDYRSVVGKCTQYVAPSAQHPFEIVELSAQARQGDSGGPILNERGELAGVLFGSSRGSTSGSFCGRVRWFLVSVWPDLDKPAEMPLDNSTGSGPAGQPSPEPPATPTPASPVPPSVPPATSSQRLLPVPPISAAPASRSPAFVSVSDVPDKYSHDPPNYAPPKFEPPERKPEISHTPPPTLEPRPQNALAWEEFAGKTRLEQLKTVLAVIGLLTVWGHVARFLTR